MSSLFNLPTSENIADPSSATDRIVHEEVTPRSSSLDGAVTIEFTSSPQRWYSPSDSYVLIGFNVHASDGAGAFTAVDYDSAVPYVGATIAQNAGANFFSAVTLSVNGVLMGTLSSPAQVSGLITKSELSADYVRTVGTGEGLGLTGAERAEQLFAIKSAGDVSDRSFFQLQYKPPLGFLRSMRAIPGARITLQFTVSPDYGSRVLTGILDAHAHTIQPHTAAAPTANSDFRVQLTSITYMAAMMSPLNSPVIPSSVILPMYEVASSAHQLPSGLTANSLQTLSFNVPSSTFKIAISCQRADAGTGDATRQKEISCFRANVVSQLSCSYAGYSAPGTAYTNARTNPERPFADFCHSTLAAQSGRATVDTLASYTDSPIYLFRYAKPANDVSTNATVRIAFDANLGTAVNVFCFAYFQSTCSMSYDSSGMCQGAEYAYAS